MFSVKYVSNVVLYFYLAILFNGDICGKLSQGTLGVDRWGSRWCRGARVR